MTYQNRKIALGFSIFILLTGIYILFYSGYPLSVDEVNIFDSVNSFVERGTLARTITYHQGGEFDVTQPPQLEPVYEPMQIIAAAPLLWIAHQIPDIGQFHTVLFLNIFVTALTGVSLYFIALKSGYSLLTGWSVALIFGLGTLALPYSRSLFREPLMGLFTLWAFFMAAQVREKPTYGRFLALILSIIGMISTKQVGFLFLPGLMLCLMPYKPSMFKKMLPWVTALFLLITAFLLVMFFLNPDFGDDRYSLQRWLNPNNWQWNHSLESFLGYQISPARSFWVYSPVLLLGLWGCLRSIKQRGNIVQSIGVLSSLLISSAAYGALRLDSYWNGGASWGPRYMVPLIPVWMLLILPVLKDFRRYGMVVKGVIITLITMSVGMQILGMAIPYSDFFFAYPAIPIAWSPQNWSWQESHITHNLRYLDLSQFDVAWRFANPTHLALLIDVVLISLSLATSVYLLKYGKIIQRKWVLLSGVLSSILVVAVITTALFSLQNDSRYILHRPDVFALVKKLNSTVHSDDVMLIDNSDFTVMLLFMNWFKPHTYYITLPEQKESENLTQYAVKWSSENFERLWLITANNRYLPQEFRPLEYQLATSLYPVTEINQGEEARAILFITSMGNQDTTTVDLPVNETRSLNLISVTTPARGHVGDTFPVTLYWRVDEPMALDVCISVQLYGRDGEIVTQQDNMPQGNFGFTSSWQMGLVYEDHHALTLPTVSGTYQLRAVVYECQGEAIDIFTLGDFQVE